MNPVTFFAAVLILASLVEGMTEYIFGDAVWAQPALKYIALVIGVLVSVAYQIDVLATLGLISPYPFIGYVFTGLIIGRGSNYVNDFVTSFQKPTV